MFFGKSFIFDSFQACWTFWIVTWDAVERCAYPGPFATMTLALLFLQSKNMSRGTQCTAWTYVKMTSSNRTSDSTLWFTLPTVIALVSSSFSVVITHRTDRYLPAVTRWEWMLVFTLNRLQKHALVTNVEGASLFFAVEITIREFHFSFAAIADDVIAT